MRALTVLTLLATLISGCATANSSAACPHISEYSKEVQGHAADELGAMPDGSIIKNVFMPDYGTMRAEVRACRSK